MGRHCHKLATLWSRQVVSWWNPFHHLWKKRWIGWWIFLYVFMTRRGNRKKNKTNDGENGDGHEELNWKSRKICQENANQVRKRKLPFLLTRFIRKENLDKRGCKITEIVERDKNQSRSDISGINSYQTWIVCLFSPSTWFLVLTQYNSLTLIRHGRHVQDTTPKREKIHREPMMSQIHILEKSKYSMCSTCESFTNTMILETPSTQLAYMQF